jgi:hypothetical protein
MPYTGPNDTKLPDNVKALAAAKRRQWVEVWNSAYERCAAQQSPGDDCEAVAFRAANGAVFEEMGLFTPPVSTGLSGLLSAAQIRELGDWTMRIQSKLSEATWMAAFVNDLPDSSFLHILPGGEKDEGGKTTPRSLRMFPYKDAGGKVDLPHLRNAVARIPQSDRINAATKERLASKARAELEKQTEQSEMDYDETPVMTMGARTFADLRAAERANDAAKEIHELTYQLQALISSVMMNEAITDKMTAIDALAAEFLGLARGILGSEMEENEPASGDSIELSESALGYALALSESDNGTNRRAPLDLDVVIIRPGFGNKRDKHFYGQQMLEANAPVFVGAKMYSTDHRDDEKSVRTEVSRIKEIVGFDNGAPVGRVKVFDPDFAELVRNRADAGELNSLECSILANGTARKGEIDGQEAKIVESIKEVRSVDWVTRGGAGGHALRLAESEVEMPKEKDEVQEAELEEVVIEEEAQAEPEPQEAETQEVAQPTTLEKEAVAAALAESNLPIAFKAALAQVQYADDAALKEAIAQAVKEVKALTGSGQPFAQGASQPVEATPLGEAEIEEKRKTRFNAIMAEVGLKGV